MKFKKRFPHLGCSNLRDGFFEIFLEEEQQQHTHSVLAMTSVGLIQHDDIIGEVIMIGRRSKLLLHF